MLLEQVKGMPDALTMIRHNVRGVNINLLIGFHLETVLIIA